MMVTDFGKVLLDAAGKYEQRKAKYGESWKIMPLYELEKRLDVEIAELNLAETFVEKYDELLDVINLALMVAERIRTR